MIERCIKQNVQYSRVEDDTRTRILSGEYPEGKALPGELPLCQEYGVSRKTIRKALEILQTQNYIRKHQGCGNFVIPAAERVMMPRITGRICVMLPEQRVNSSFSGELLAGIYKAASASSAAIQILSHSTPASVLLEMYHNFECDAFIWGAIPEALPEAIPFFARMRIPQVVVNEKVSGTGSVLYDSHPAWRSLLNTLNACGHIQAAFIDRNEKHYWTQARQDAFLRAAKEFNMEGTVFRADAETADLSVFLDTHPEITAFITAKPLSEIFLKLLAKRKKKIAADVSWAEFSFGETVAGPEVARIYIPVQKMGSEAIRLLLSHDFRVNPSPEIYVPCFSVMGLSVNKNRVVSLPEKKQISSKDEEFL